MPGNNKQMNTSKGHNPIRKNKENQRPPQGLADSFGPPLPARLDFLTESQAFKQGQKKIRSKRAQRPVQGLKTSELTRYSSNDGLLGRVFQELDARQRRGSDHVLPGVRKGQVKGEIKGKARKQSGFARSRQNQNFGEKRCRRVKADLKNKSKVSDVNKPRRKKNVGKNVENKDSQKSNCDSKKRKSKKLNSYKSNKSIFGSNRSKALRKNPSQFGNSNSFKVAYKGLGSKKRKISEVKSNRSNESNFGSKKRNSKASKSSKTSNNIPSKKRGKQSPSWKNSKSRKQGKQRMKLSIANMSLAQNHFKASQKPLLSCRNNRASGFFTSPLEDPSIKSKGPNDRQKLVIFPKSNAYQTKTGRRPVTSIHHLASLLERGPVDEARGNGKIFENLDSNTSILFNCQLKENKNNISYKEAQDQKQSAEYNFARSNGSFLTSRFLQRPKNDNPTLANESTLLAKKLAPAQKKSKHIFSFNKEKQEMLKNNMMGFDSRVFNGEGKQLRRPKNSFLMLQSKFNRSISEAMKGSENTNNMSLDMRYNGLNCSGNQQIKDQDFVCDNSKVSNPFSMNEYRNKHLGQSNRVQNEQSQDSKREVNLILQNVPADAQNFSSNLPLNNNSNNNNPKKTLFPTQNPANGISKRPKRASFLDRLKNIRNLSSLQINPVDSHKENAHCAKHYDFQEKFENARNRVQMNRLRKQKRNMANNTSLCFAFGENNQDTQNLSLNAGVSNRGIVFENRKAVNKFGKHSRVTSTETQEEKAGSKYQKNSLHRKTPSLNLNFVPDFGNKSRAVGNPFDLKGHAEDQKLMIPGSEMFGKTLPRNSLQSFEKDIRQIAEQQKLKDRPVASVSGMFLFRFIVILSIWSII